MQNPATNNEIHRNPQKKTMKSMQKHIKTMTSMQNPANKKWNPCRINKATMKYMHNQAKNNEIRAESTNIKL